MPPTPLFGGSCREIDGWMDGWMDRLAEGFEALSGACSCESCLGNACGELQELPWKGLREGLRGLRAGKRQS